MAILDRDWPNTLFKVRENVLEGVHGPNVYHLLSAFAGLVLYYNTSTRLAVIRCARELCKMVETSLVFVTDVHNQDVSIRVTRVCGTNAWLLPGVWLSCIDSVT